MTPEGYVLKSILQWLQIKGYYAMRINSGMVKREYKGKSYVVRSAAPGTADILAFIPCYDCNRGFIPLWIECKSAVGRQSEIQKSFELDVLEKGHQYILARSIEDVEVFLSPAKSQY